MRPDLVRALSDAGPKTPPICARHGIWQGNGGQIKPASLDPAAAGNQHLTAPAGLDTLTEAAIYPDAIALAATAPGHNPPTSPAW